MCVHTVHRWILLHTAIEMNASLGVRGLCRAQATLPEAVTIASTIFGSSWAKLEETYLFSSQILSGSEWLQGCFARAP